MIRDLKGISRSLAALAVLAAALSCTTDDPKNPGQSFQSPTGPFAGIQITIGANPQNLQIGDDEKTSRIHVEAFHTANWTPVANGTEASFTATLGAIDSPTGARTATIPMFDGKAEISLFPGTSAGTARITVEVAGAIATVNVTIEGEAEPPVPAPTASTLALTANPSTISEQVAQDGDGPQSVMLTATVLGSGGDPFAGGGIFFTTPLGTFSNLDATSAIFTTNSAGQVIEFLSVEDAALLAFSGSSFQVTAHLGIEGGEKTATTTISIGAGQGLPEATNVILTSNENFIVDDGGMDEELDLVALVQDQFGADFEGGVVTFSSSFASASFAPVSDVSDVNGEVPSTVTFPAASITAHPTNTFTITATLTRPVSPDTSTITITIVRPPNADFSFAGTSGSPVYNFTDESTGNPTSWAWDFDGDGTTDESTAQNPTGVDLTAEGCADPCPVKMTASNLAGSSTVIKNVPNPMP
jgi:hypothetical protein